MKNTERPLRPVDELSVGELAKAANDAFYVTYGFSPLMKYEKDDGENSLQAVISAHLSEIDGAEDSHPHKKKTLSQRYALLGLTP